jgi:hypothetical protein
MTEITQIEGGIMTTAPTVNSLGGTMYGDGEFVVNFENVNSDQAPMVATVMAGDDGYTVGPFADFERPSVLLASQIIARVRTDRRAA